LDFSFFRKDKPKDKPAAKKTGKAEAIAAINEAPLTEERFDTVAVLGGGIEVVETGARLAPGIEEAAMLYANNRAAEAIKLLTDYLVSHRAEDAHWRMLFDLYRAGHQQAEFEQLALDYAVKCETSPPVWQSSDSAANQPTARTDKTASSGQMFSLKGTLDQASADRIQLLVDAAAHGAIQLDLSSISAVTPAGCSLLKNALAKLQKKSAPLQIASGALVNLLQHAVHDPAQRDPAHWLLLLQLYQMQGKLAEFEDLAVDYAVTFEVSPPSWETPRAVAQTMAAPPAAVEPEIAPNTYAMRGAITGSSTAVFAEFQAFAARHSEVALDLGAVQRVEFSSVNLFMDALMALLQTGKQVRIINGNEMVNVVLIVMGVDQMAQVMHRK
jgi:ABC-type transporter Mla MlaB component